MAARRPPATSTSRRRWRRSRFFTIIIAGTRAHGFVKHWTNLVPHGMPLPLYVLLIPLEIIGMFVRPFALTMRLAANMTGGHIAILAITSFVFIFAEMAVGRAGERRRHRPACCSRCRSRPACSGLEIDRRPRAGLRLHACCRPCSSAWPFTRITNTSVSGEREQCRTQRSSRNRWPYCGITPEPGSASVWSSSAPASASASWRAGVAEGVARQPSATAQISGATNLPLFLLEGVAILARVFCLLIVSDRSVSRRVGERTERE